MYLPIIISTIYPFKKYIFVAYEMAMHNVIAEMKKLVLGIGIFRQDGRAFFVAVMTNVWPNWTSDTGKKVNLPRAAFRLSYCVVCYTGHPRYIVVSFHQTEHERYPIARPWGRGMGAFCEFRVLTQFWYSSFSIVLNIMLYSTAIYQDIKT